MNYCRHTTRAGTPCRLPRSIGHSCARHADDADRYYAAVIGRLVTRHMGDIEFYLGVQTNLQAAVATARRGAS